MSQDFYDKVAKKFGNYHTNSKYIKEFMNGSPEEIFKRKLLKVSSKNKVALDVGCADGRFTLSMSPNFKRIIAIDTSDGMLRAAERNKKASNLKNVDFVKQDVHKMTFPANSFDVIYDRRGPTDFPLFYKVLKPGGFLLNISIGEKDTAELKKIFGRGQNFGEWNKSKLSEEKEQVEKAGFKMIYSEDFHYNEYYLSFKDLDVFLQGVPIFEDYDFKKDKKYLEEYVGKFKNAKGIDLPRHRYVIVAVKR